MAHLQLIYPVKIVILHSYVSSPEGISLNMGIISPWNCPTVHLLHLKHLKPQILQENFGVLSPNRSCSPAAGEKDKLPPGPEPRL